MKVKYLQHKAGGRIINIETMKDGRYMAMVHWMNGGKYKTIVYPWELSYPHDIPAAVKEYGAVLTGSGC